MQARLTSFRIYRQISRQSLKQIDVIEHTIVIIKEMLQSIVSAKSEQESGSGLHLKMFGK